MNLAELKSIEYPPQEWVVPGLVAFGQLTVLAGTAKAARKSWMAADLALAASGASHWLGSFPAHEAPVLYLGNEDSPHRLQERLRRLQGAQERSTEADQRLQIETAWPTYEEGGLDLIGLWAELEDRPSVVIIDVLANFRELAGSIRRDRRLIAELASFAHQTGVALVVVAHLRKGKIRPDTNWTDNLAGTSGVSAAADTLLGVDVLLNATSGRMLITGKDVESQIFGLELAETGCWQVTSEEAVASGPELSPERQLLLTVVGQGAGGRTAGQIHEAAPYGPSGAPWSYDSVRQNLYQAWKAGVLENRGGHFFTHEQIAALSDQQAEMFQPGFVPRIVTSG